MNVGFTLWAVYSVIVQNTIMFGFADEFQDAILICWFVHNVFVYGFIMLSLGKHFSDLY